MTFHTVTYCKKANMNVTSIYQHVTNEKKKKWKEIEVSVEIVLKKIEGYVIKNYLYLIKLMSKYLEVSISISTDSLPTSYRQITNRRPTCYRLSADRSLKLWKKTVGWQWADSRPRWAVLHNYQIF